MIVQQDGATFLRSRFFETVAVVYADIPFNSGSERTRGDHAYDDARSRDDFLALVYNLVASACVALRPGGALWVHCDESADWLVRGVLESFECLEHQNNAIWHYSNKLAVSAKRLSSAHDTIYLYSKRGAPFLFTPIKEKRDAPKRFQKRKWQDGKLINDRDADGRTQYIERNERNVTDVWTMPHLLSSSDEWAGYPTQKPLALLERIIACTSFANDLIVDPCCGSGTTLLAARRLGRRYAGADISRDAVDVATRRLGA